ncbi:SrfA family protein [Magnetospirillum sulfuroxidans]|uniref:Virulence factor n=1 Tax=Magnetospirillum sulfuroxidans TaxID=611300 RepID=A0ABS5IA47_9PROT|nr:SrfA family protein [Magnetospirillum sulfuroxidans]MBR9971146.1 hypothetical protein [Magnetospirillum sulfuroxidans]
MSGLLLRTGRLREYNALGSVGRPVYTAASQLRALVKRMLGPECADMLAMPQINEAGDTISWYASSGSTVVPWAAASEEERAPARAAMLQARQDFQRRSTEMLGQASNNQDMEVFARLLPLATQIPDESHIHLVDGRPVITFWGFGRLNAAPETDIIRDLGLHAAIPTPPSPAMPPPPILAAPAVVLPWWRRLWWLWLLLLLLLLLLLFGLRSCGPEIPLLGVIAPTEELPRTDLPQAAIPQTEIPGVGIVPQGGSGPLVGGTRVIVPDGTIGADSVTAPEGTKPDAPAADIVPPKVETKDGTPPPETKDAAKPGADKNGTVAPTKPATPPPPPLVLPDTALKEGAVTFLDGHWRSRTGLMDSQTGRPLEVEYDFKDGKGTATILRSDGTKCPAPVEASIKGNALLLNQTAAAKCGDGQVFDRSQVQCRQGKDGKAECKGVNADGGGYFVEIVK